MFCVGVNRKEVVIGENKFVLGRQRRHGYPDFSSIHAELDFYYKAKRRSFVPQEVFVFGFRGGILKNSMPCAYCSALLLELGFKRISFFLDGEIVSMTREDFERLVEAGLPKSYE